MEMDLRLILLIVGGLVVGGIILDGMRRRRKTQSQEKIDTFDEKVFEKTSDSLQDPLLEGYFSKSSENKIFKTPKSQIEGFQTTETRSEPIPSLSHHARMTEDPEEIIALTIIPSKNRFFSGGSLLSALQAAEMHYGDKEIFHRYGVHSGNEYIAFSLASMTEPGVFDLQLINQKMFSGIMLFMVLPGPYDPLMTFEQMLSAARKLASNLGGQLCDHKRSHLTIQSIEHCREKIREFMRHRLAQQR
ncbi:MAG: cell division protein ZipA C-terminal FtsZ-binding domain-containing protein [Gammaproteobacteria bacterium]